MVKPIDWDDIESAEEEAVRKHARAEFRVAELQKELADLKGIVDNTTDKNQAFKKIRGYQKRKRSIFGQIEKLDRSKDYTAEGIRKQYESFLGEVEPSDSSSTLRDDEKGNEDDVL